MFKVKLTSKVDQYHNHWLCDSQAIYRLNYVEDGQYEVYMEDVRGNLKLQTTVHIERIELGLREHGWRITKYKPEGL